MLFSGSSFFLSPKLPIPDTRTLRELINSNGGKICSNASNKETFIIVDSWDVDSLYAEILRGEAPPVVGTTSSRHNDFPESTGHPSALRSVARGSSYIKYCAENHVRFEASHVHMLCMALKGITVCITGAQADAQKQLTLAVQWCGGSLQSEVNSGASVLVVGHASSGKLDIARSLNIPIVAIEWIQKCFATKTLVEYSLFPVKPLRGATIAITGFRPSSTREAVKDLIISLGARFIPQVENHPTHLIVSPLNLPTAKGSKYYFAKQESIHVLPLVWLQECQRLNCWVSEDDHEISHPSTDPIPKRERQHANQDQRAAPAASSSANPSSVSNVSKLAAPANSSSSEFISKYTYLEGSNIFLCCATPSQLEHFRPIVLQASGMLTQDPLAATIIVVCLDSGTALIPSSVVGQLSRVAPNLQPPFLAHPWLEACSAQKQAVTTGPYIVTMDSNTRLVQWKMPEKTPAPLHLNYTSEAAAPSSKKRPPSDMDNLLHDVDMQDVLEPYLPPDQKKISRGVDENRLGQNDHDLPLLHKLAFISVGIKSFKLEELIERHGGKFFHWPVSAFNAEQYKTVYFVVPHGIYSSHKSFGFSNLDFLALYGAKVVTIQWLEHVTNIGHILCPSTFPLLFTPLPFLQSKYHETMHTVSLCIGSLSESETYLLTLLALFMGCSSAGEPLYPKRTTHVISLKSEGKKQRKAVERGIPLVTPEWLYCCAKVGGKVDEQAFKLRLDISSTQGPRIIDMGLKQVMPPPPPIGAEPSLEEEYESVNFYSKSIPDPRSYTRTTEMIEEAPRKKPTVVPYNHILQGVTVYFGKSLRSQQEELAYLANSMGAETSWTFDVNVTHYVNQGKPELPTASAKMVKGGKAPVAPDHKPHFVSPQWLRKCSEDGRRVLEALYPASMDPRITLGIIADGSGSLSSTTIEYESKRVGLTIHNDNPLSSSQSSRLSVSRNPSAISQTKRMISSVTIPKTRVEADFDEFDNIDARYSAQISASPPHTTKSMPAPTIIPIRESTVSKAASVEEDYSNYDDGDEHIPHEVAPIAATAVEIPIEELPTESIKSEPTKMDVVQEIQVADTPFGASTDPMPPVPEPTEAPSPILPPAPDVMAVDGAVDGAVNMAVDVPSDVAAIVKPEIEIPPPPLPSTTATDPMPPPATELEHLLNKTLNSSVLDSQDPRFEGAGTQSQIVDSKTFEETMAQTELMRKLLANLPNQRPTHRTPTTKPLPPKPTSEDSNDSAPVSFAPHISRSALLELGASSNVNSGLGNGESLVSSGSDKSGHSSSTDLNDDGISSSPPIPLEYLQSTDADDSHAPRVSYAALEPSEAVKSKLLGRAQLHLDSSTFQQNAAAEIRKLELMVATPMLPQEKPNSSVSRTSSKSSIRSDSKVLTPASVIEPIVVVASPAKSSSKTAIVIDELEDEDALSLLLDDSKKKSIFAGSNSPAAPVRDEIVDEVTNISIFGKPKRKADAHNTSTTVGTSTSTSTSTAAAPTSPRFSKSSVATSTSSKKGSKSETVEIEDAEFERNKMIRVYLSGFDNTQKDKDEKERLKTYALQLGMNVCASSDFNWTHFVAKVYRNTDKSMISLACGRWILDIRWLEDSWNSKKRVQEEKYEYRGNSGQKQLADPRKCRRAVAKLGRGIFQDMSILYFSKQTVWKTVLINSGAKVDTFKPDPAKPIPISTIMKYNLVYTTATDWASLQSPLQAILDKSSVVVCDYFVEYLRSAVEPERESYHPNCQRG